MFSLSATVLSIALVALIALATKEGVNDAYAQARAEVTATQVLIQGQQLLAAAELFRATTGAWPRSLDALVGQANYLVSLPRVEGHTWRMPLEGQPVFVLRTGQTSACQSLNKHMYGVAGVLDSANGRYRIQCYGRTPDTLQIVVAKDSESLVRVGESALASPAVRAVHFEPIPLASAVYQWVIPPALTRAKCASTGPLTASTGRRHVFCA